MSTGVARRALVARLDSDGDVLLAGPAVRAVAAGSEHVTLLVSPSGEQAARLLPGVDKVLVWRCPFTGFVPPPVDADDTLALVERLRGHDVAVVLTSYHQSPLPLALLLRLAGVPRIVASSTDYPGSLLDVRHPPGGPHEVQRGLSLAAAAGFALPSGDDDRLQVRRPLPPVTVDSPYVVVHPSASVPARAPLPAHAARLVQALAEAGHQVVVTGGPADVALAEQVAGDSGTSIAGATTFAQLAGVLAGASALVCGNTGPAHLAAAVGTPVVSLFAPVVAAEAWRPWGVPTVLLGDQGAACAASRARACPVAGHPCLSGIDPADVVRAVEQVALVAA
ncbi:MAG TPA: glycosyltransferase family 9 protein [Actinomycetales bacterium]